MLPYLFIFVCLIALMAMIFLLARTTLSLSFENRRFRASLSMLKCGFGYDSRGNRIALTLLGWRFNLDTDKKTRAKKKKKKDKKRDKKAEEKKKKSRKYRLKFSTIVQIVKAFVFFVARMISRVRCDEGRLDLQPMIADPALAGMAYGWGQAVMGAWPAFGRAFNFTPGFGSGQGKYSGSLVLSINNGQVVGLLWRLFRDLPIIELIKYFYSKRGK